MKAVAANLHDGVQFKGVAYDQERAAIVEHLPNEGVDIQDEPLYWVLPDGRCECWTVRKLHAAQPDELVHTSEETVDEAYQFVAKAFGYEILGKASDEHIDAFRAEPGTLRDRFWEKYSWTKPVDETASCWWLANAAEADKTQTVKLKCRSVACLRLELQTVRVATVSKLKKGLGEARERQRDGNQTHPSEYQPLEACLLSRSGAAPATE